MIFSGLSPWIFTKLMDVIATLLHQHAFSLFWYLDDWLIRDLICNRHISHNILPSKSRVHSKFKEVVFDTSSAIHLHRDGISDTTQYSQGTSRLHQIPTSNYQTISNSDSSFGMNFPFSFGKLNAVADFVLLGRLHLRQLQMCLLILLTVFRPHILPLDHQVPINSMI